MKTLTLRLQDEEKAIYQADEDHSLWQAIRNGFGEVTGYTEVFYHNSSNRYMTVPGASRFVNA